MYVACEDASLFKPKMRLHLTTEPKTSGLAKKKRSFYNHQIFLTQNIGKLSDIHIRIKIDSLREEILLLERAGYKVTENCNSSIEFSNPKTSFF